MHARMRVSTHMLTHTRTLTHTHFHGHKSMCTSTETNTHILPFYSTICLTTPFFFTQGMEHLSLIGLHFQNCELMTSNPLAHTAVSMALLCTSLSLDPTCFSKSKVLDALTYRVVCVLCVCECVYCCCVVFRCECVCALRRQYGAAVHLLRHRLRLKGDIDGRAHAQ